MTKKWAGAFAISALGLALISQHEGLRTRAYVDPAGIPTICAGSTRDVFVGQRATLAECEQRLQEDSSYAGKAIAQCTSVKLSQEQYDALVSFAFNVGGGAYCRSTLVKKLNRGDCLGAANEFPRWNRAGGRVLPGLTKRRHAEKTLFLKGCPA